MALDQLGKIVRNDFHLKELEQHLSQEKSVRLNHVTGSLASFLIQTLRRPKRNILVICPEHELAQFMVSDLQVLEAEKVVLFPPTFHKPYDSSQMRDTSAIVRRSEVLETLMEGEGHLIVTSAAALFDKIASPESFSRASIKINKGDHLEMESLMETLAGQGYSLVSFVDEAGEFSNRGGILDVYPYSGEYPVRLEFFGNEIESIREFDSDSQRSVAYLDQVLLVPNIDELDNETRENLFDYLPGETIIIMANAGLTMADLDNRYKEAVLKFESLPDGQPKPRIPDQLFLSTDGLNHYLQSKAVVYLGGLSTGIHIDKEWDIGSIPQPDFNGSIKILRKNIQDLSADHVETYILCDNEGQRDRFEELLGEQNDSLRYHMVIRTLHEGFILKKSGLAVYTDHQIFNRYHRPNLKQRKRHGGISFKELRDLQVGDFVVHVDYGIGRFAGFTKISVRNIEQEAVKLLYENDSILYVNVSSLHKLQKYSGKDGARPKLTKLGSGEWARKKAKTKSRLKDIARDLIKLYAKRKSQKAFAFSPDTNWQTELEASFRYEETEDQINTIEAVKNDMQNETPMDRLVCGDVGFGKTEVAVRAAFKAVMDQKQVAVLVPTTILADQHYETFRERMKNFPVNVEVISRFRSASDQKKILKMTSEGKIDILIGTHRITSKDVTFKDLGLLIVDEEQRFGVSVKEKLKEFRATVDVLTLTATPIPRTLHMSLMGARDLSIINTPPPNRQPVYTEIHSFDSRLIRDAILQETSRGGQVFIIHNRVRNIGEFSAMIQQLVPNIRVRFAHGQMSGRQLEKIITDFYHKNFDVLVSTNIVENGIDISNANTIIINHADRFGLSELHQLRGRVGRSNRKAYCYLITPPLEDLSMDARKRLLALEEYSDLGSGFNIAMRDLDIRGAGDILGAEQSGFINEIGFDLYTKILNDAVNELKETEFKGLFEEEIIKTDYPETTVECDLSAMLPKLFVADNVERLNLYRKLAEAGNDSEINNWKEEVEDRFGKLPGEARNLIHAARIKLAASPLFLDKVTIRSNRMWLQCPNAGTDTGYRFYEKGIFQYLIGQLEKKAEGRYRIMQKNKSVHIMIEDIPDLENAIELLHEIQQPQEINSVV